MKRPAISSQLCLHHVGERAYSETLREGLEFHRAAGFAAADLPLYSLISKELTIDTALLDRLLRDSEEVGVKLGLCHLPFSARTSTDPDYLPEFNERMRVAIDAVAYLGIDCAVLHPNTTTRPTEELDEKWERENVLAHLSPFAEHASRVGLTLALENMRVVHKHYPTRRYCQYPEEVCDIADTLGMSVCWDFGHANLSGVSQSEGLAKVGRRLRAIHINDNTGADDEHLPPFIGRVDWRDAMKGLALTEYEGVFNFELATHRVPENMRTAFAAYVRAAAEELLSYIPL